MSWTLDASMRLLNAFPLPETVQWRRSQTLVPEKLPSNIRIPPPLKLATLPATTTLSNRPVQSDSM